MQIIDAFTYHTMNALGYFAILCAGAIMVIIASFSFFIYLVNNGKGGNDDD